MPVLAAEDTFRGSAYARIEVDAAGAVQQVEVDPAIGAAIASRLERAIARWSFEPARRAGQALPSVTHATLAVRAEPESEGYALFLDSVANGPRIVENAHPGYPRGALRRGEQGRIVVEGTVQPDGSFKQLEIVAGADRKQLARATLEAAQDWRFEPERVGGEAIATRVRVPVDFAVFSCRFQAECERKLVQTMAAGADAAPRPVDGPGGIPVAMDSPIRLRDDVTGPVL